MVKYYSLLFTDRFQYMAMADNRQRVMPFPEDRMPGRCETLGFAEAVLLVNPKNQDLKGEVVCQYCVVYLYCLLY